MFIVMELSVLLTCSSLVQPEVSLTVCSGSWCLLAFLNYILHFCNVCVLVASMRHVGRYNGYIMFP